MNLPFYTIGHSTRPLEEFVALLRVADVRVVADIRTIPRSRANPQYNKDALPESLAAFQIAYEFIPGLGGLRGKARLVPSDVNGFWQNQSFHNYADYALSGSFRAGLERLTALGRERRCAMMCSEAVWWRCHRRIVSDHLLARGETVLHLMGRDRIEPARLTQGAQIGPSGAVVYPPQGVTPAP
ncbi:MAG TPA: DUF488 domain-containing protein [Hyphomicrobium sp.]|nr:DUF488 domain-containing protein [Hyphomicrobium sp.]